MNLKIGLIARHQWLMPIILASQEAEIRRITVQSQPGQIVRETLSRKNPSQNKLVYWPKMKALSLNLSTTKEKKIDLIETSSPNFSNICAQTHSHKGFTWCKNPVHWFLHHSPSNMILLPCSSS
jgi:hypothetical protein